MRVQRVVRSIFLPTGLSDVHRSLKGVGRINADVPSTHQPLRRSFFRLRVSTEDFELRSELSEEDGVDYYAVLGVVPTLRSSSGCSPREL